MIQRRGVRGLSFQLPRAPREKGGSNLEATCKDLRFLRDSIINTTTKKYITMQQTHSSSPHRLHEEESTDRRRRRSGRKERLTRCHSQELDFGGQRPPMRRGCCLVTRYVLPQEHCRPCHKAAKACALGRHILITMDSSSPQREAIKDDDETQGNDDEFGTTSPVTASGNKRKTKSAAAVKKKKITSTRSTVWNHYTRLKENRNKCSCNYCGRVMRCATSNGTSCLKKHLGICKEHQAWVQSQSQTQHTLNAESDDEDGVQLKLARVSNEVVREATNELLVISELPLSFVDGLGWKHFCNKVNLPKPHSRRTATSDIVELYAKRKSDLMQLISGNKQRVSLKTDIWVASSTSASYMVITAHFIDDRWKLRKFIIGFKHVTDHKGATICSVLLECMAEWGIKKVFTITVDNATANTNALKLFRDAFNALGPEFLVLGEVDASVCAISNAIQYIRASFKRAGSFDQKVESARMTRGSLSLDCKTRWNSTYLMLSRALKFRAAFDRMEVEDKLYNDHFQETVEGKKRVGPPTSEDWDKVEGLVKFLVIFYNSTLVVSASNSPSSYKCYNEIVTIERNLITLSTSTDEKLRTKAMVMRAKFNKYWDGLKDINRLLIVASVFDPRNKMKFAGLCFEKLYGKDSPQSKVLYDSVIDVMERLFDEYNASAASHTAPAFGSSSQSQSVQESQDEAAMDSSDENEYGYERMDSLYKEMVNELGFQDASTELELYLKEKVEIPKPNPLGIPFDVLGWSRINSSKYPTSAAIAKDVLAMQVSSVASESAFSTSNRILDLSRSCLTHYMIEMNYKEGLSLSCTSKPESLRLRMCHANQVLSKDVASVCFSLFEPLRMLLQFL
ncbi:PREDICTED: zinc finger BED domain-containing protein RICESLEEPER 2-like [Brassica oleracea var. oleracea]|uniref:zinc finger BED domain-containing protein RICESLEEPER 2-like n=1 Tax=Brassica oleracea var. oleracea TaxID=109376 RepID=UPI0006A74D79|nr:PREDICTED: zinc finger BED domain-containing protein RICESLEEPER 2-like [Brassica oleracea var. oleracea]